MTRDSVALRPPARPLTGFPDCEVTTAQKLIRGHRTVNGPWWFSSDGGGRFDLTPPRGTCYLAFDELTAIRETVGEALATTGVISDTFAAARQLSTLVVPHDHRVADTCAEKAADFGLTRELVSMTPYAVPQEWAASFDAVSFAGLRYQTPVHHRAEPERGRPVRGRRRGCDMVDRSEPGTAHRGCPAVRLHHRQPAEVGPDHLTAAPSVNTSPTEPTSPEGASNA